MSSSSSPALTLALRWSRQRVLVVAAQLLIFLVMPQLVFRWSLVLCLGTTLVGLSVTAWGCYQIGWLGLGWLGRRRATTVSWQSSGEWLIETAEGRKLPARLQENSQVGSGFLCLRLSTVGPGSRSRYRLLLIRGELEENLWRRLQARLRLEGSSSAASDLQGMQ